MRPSEIAILLMPLAKFVLLALVVLPIEWVLFRIIPHGRLKVALFKERSGETATWRDQLVMAVGGVIGYVFLGGLVAFLSSR